MLVRYHLSPVSPANQHPERDRLSNPDRNDVRRIRARRARPSAAARAGARRRRGGCRSRADTRSAPAANLSDEIWQSVARRSTRSSSASRRKAANRASGRSSASPTTRSTLFVKVRAFDTDADKIVSYLTRRDADSPSDWIRVLIDSYHDKRTAYEFARQSGRREARSLLVQRQQPRRQLGRGVGREGLARRRRLDRGIPHPVFAAPLQPDASRSRSASRSRGRSAG